MKIRWTLRAMRRLEQEIEFISLRDKDYAVNLYALIQKQVNSLSIHPSKGRMGRIPNTRELIITGTPYIIPYEVNSNTVQILAVFHSSRKPVAKW